MIAATIRPSVAAKLRQTMWRCAALGLVVAAGAHLLLLVVFKPMPKVRKAETAHERFTWMLNPSQLSANDPWGVSSALKYGDPTLFAKPDERYGFSSYRSIRQAEARFPSDLPNESNGVFSGLQQGRFSVALEPSNVLACPPSLWLHYESSTPSQAPAVPKVFASVEPPVWLDSSFRPLGRLADPRGEIAKLLAAGPKPLYDTIVMVGDSGPNLPPYAQVVKSSGNVALDSAAVRSLTSSIESMPEAMPKDGDRTMLFLKWSADCQLRHFEGAVVK